MEIISPSSAKKIKEVYICLTDMCNLNCSFCFYDKGNLCIDSEFVYTNLGMIYKHTQSKHIRIVFFGGEPTLRLEAIDRIVKYCLNMDKQTEFTLVTNGVIDLNKVMNPTVIDTQVSLYRSCIDKQILNIKNNERYFNKIYAHLTLTKENINDNVFLDKIFNSRIPFWINLDFYFKGTKDHIDKFFFYLYRKSDDDIADYDYLFLNNKVKPGRECLKQTGESIRLLSDNRIGTCSFSDKIPNVTRRPRCMLCDNKWCRVCSCDIFDNNVIDIQCYFYRKVKEFMNH